MSLDESSMIEKIFKTGNHDMLAWLNNIKISADMLLKLSDHLTPEQQKQMIGMIGQSAQQCQQFLKTKIDTFILVTAKRFSEPDEPLDLAPLVHDVIAARQKKAAHFRQTIDIQLEIMPDLPPLIANEQRFLYFLRILFDMLPANTLHVSGHLKLHKDQEHIRVILTPLELVTPEHGELLSLLVAANGGGDIAIDGGTLQFILYGTGGARIG